MFNMLWKIFMLPRPSLTCLLLLAVTLIASSANAAPVPEDERLPLDLRRTTLVVRDLDQRWDSVLAVPGVEVLSEPEETSYPSYDGEGTISVMVSVIRDPDGFVVELNQLLTELH
ncbi:MAG: hypothetical protein ACI87W_001788 [Halieaceae bacterium]|jgi:hypothetical protein